MARLETGFDALLAELRACRHCAGRFRETASGHAPNPILRGHRTARLCIAGQAPGIRAHMASTPFLDPSGDRLRDWMAVDATTFYDEARIAILPMGFCFPGHDARRADLPPPRDCADLWRARLFAAFPGFACILLVGKAAQDWHLGDRAPLAERVRGWTEGRCERPHLVPLPHPSWRNNAWLKAHPWFETETLPKLRATIAAVLA